jgi:hypothetical protein
MSASRLFDIAAALEAPIEFFFAGLAPTAGDGVEHDVLSSEETRELIVAYYGVSARSRRRLLDLAKALYDDAGAAKSGAPPLPGPTTRG